MSTMFVNKIQELNVGSGVTIPSNVKAAGHIIQLISVEATGNYSFNTATGTYTDVNGLILNITPKFNDSKIFLTAKVDISSANNQRWGLRFTRDGAVPPGSIGGPDGSRTRSHSSGQGYGTNGIDANVGMQFLDSPATTSQVTYRVQVTCEGSNQVVINRSITHTDSATVYTALSTLTAMEVAQ